MNKFLTVTLFLFASTVYGQYATNIDYKTEFANLDKANPFVKSIHHNGKTLCVSQSYVSGENHNMLVTQFDSDGDVDWLYNINGASNQNDYGIDVGVNSIGDIIAVGTINNPGSNYDLIVVKLNSSGIFQWQYVYDNMASTSDEVPSKLYIDEFDNIFVTGQIIKSESDNDAFTLKLNNLGELLWTEIFDNSGNDDGGIDLNTNVGNAEILALSTSTGGASSLYKILYDENNGIQSFSYNISATGSSIEFVDIKKRSDGKYITCINFLQSGNWNSKIFCLDNTLGQVWADTLCDTAISYRTKGFTIDENDNAYFLTTYNDVSTSTDVQIVKYNESGTEIWTKSHFLVDSYNPNASCLNVQDDKIFLSMTTDIGYKDNSCLNTMVDTNGNVVWKKLYEIEDTNKLVPISCQFIGDDTCQMLLRKDMGDSSKLELTRYSLFEKDTTTNYADTSELTRRNHQLIIRFNDVINTSIVDNLDLEFKKLEDFITQEAIDELDSLFDDTLDWKNYYASKIHQNLTTEDTISLTRGGDTVFVPPVWRTLLIQLPEALHLDSITPTFDSADINSISYAEVNRVLSFPWAPSDAKYSQQGQLKSISGISDAHIHVEDAWNYSKGREEIRIGNLDGLMNWQHDDFQLKFNSSGKGRFDESKILGGWNYIDGIALSASTEFYDHGTATGSQIGALNNNIRPNEQTPFGMAGVAGGDMSQNNSGCGLFNLVTAWGTSAIISAAVIEGVLFNPNNGRGYRLNIMNNEYWDPDGENRINKGFQGVVEAFRFAQRNEVLMVCAAGNRGSKFFNYPGSFADQLTIKVGSSDKDNKRFDSGQEGSSWGYNLDVLAPSEKAINTLAVGQNKILLPGNDSKNGTSFAMPLVSGLAGLMKSYYDNVDNVNHPQNLTPEDIEWLISNSAEDLNYNLVTNSGYDERTGYGKVRADKALNWIDKSEFLIHHFTGTTTSETKICEDCTIKIEDDYFQSVNETGKLSDDNQDLIKNKKYKADIYKVTIEIEADWPVGNYEIFTGSLVSGETPYWILYGRSNLWRVIDPSLSSRKIDPYTDLTWITTPYRDGNKLKAKLEGNIIYVLNKTWDSESINKWFPHADDIKHKAGISVYFQKKWTSGQQNPVHNMVSVFPNPASEKATLLVNENLIGCSLKIFDARGMVIYDSEVSNEMNSLSTRNWNSGLYIIRVYSKDENFTAKFEIIK
ncbi:MAG: S8 family peptidase [Bacteroidetes bacterium]|nr:S8 family peptidase [Bacteroidota bacterium]